LPFQPEEEECLDHIIRTAQDFRNSIAHLIKPIMSTPDDLPVQRFYLRKIEGAEVLLVEETNFLRQQVHQWAPVAPEPPRMIEVSLSTRKPRPTKVQKLMAQLGISREEDLPENMRPKVTRKRTTNDYISGKGSKPANPSSAAKPGESVQSHTPPGMPHETPTPTGSNIRSPLDSVSQHHHHSVPSHHHSHSGSFGYSSLTLEHSHSESPPVVMPGPSAFAAPTSPLFPTASTSVGEYRSGAATHGGGDAVDPQLEDMFGSSINAPVSPLHHHGSHVPQHVHSHSAGSNVPNDDLFRSLTNGEADDGDPDATLGTVEDGPAPFGFSEGDAGYPTVMETDGY
jgi:[histone H3]-trimethyl-L-lysine4 demethylase